MLWKRSPRSLSIRFGAKTDVGQVRSENQDDYGRFPEVQAERNGDQVFIVADGMGGHEDGGQASRAAVEAIGDTEIIALRGCLLREVMQAHPSVGLLVMDWLVNHVHEAHERIQSLAVERTERRIGVEIEENPDFVLEADLSG